MSVSLEELELRVRALEIRADGMCEDRGARRKAIVGIRDKVIWLDLLVRDVRRDTGVLTGEVELLKRSVGAVERDIGNLRTMMVAIARHLGVKNLEGRSGAADPAGRGVGTGANVG